MPGDVVDWQQKRYESMKLLRFFMPEQGKMESTQHFDFSNCTSTIHDAVLISMRWTSMGPALCHVHLQILDSGAGSTLCYKHWLAYMTQGSRPDVASKVMQRNFKALFAHPIMSSSSTTLVVVERQVVAGAEIRDQAAYQKWSRAQRCLSAKDYQCWSCGQSGKKLACVSVLQPAEMIHHLAVLA